METIPSITVHGIPRGSSSTFSVDVYHGEKRLGRVRPKGKLTLRRLAVGDELIFRMQVLETTCKVTTSDIYLNSDAEGNLAATFTDTSLAEECSMTGEVKRSTADAGAAELPTAIRVVDTVLRGHLYCAIVRQICVFIIILILVVLWLIS